MYQRPQLEKFGSFRQLTAGGGATENDFFTTDSTDNCVSVTPSGQTTEDIVCRRSV